MSDLKVIIDEIKRLTNLRHVIPDLIKSGSNYFAHCWKHTEKTPSCHVNEDFFYCFGCGNTGDVFTYHQQTKNLDFMEALRLAALDAGVVFDDNISVQVQKMVEERDKRVEDLQFYQSRLETMPAVKEYLANRGITNEAIKYFGLGYNPDWNAIALPMYSKSGSVESISFRYLDPNNTQRYYHKNTATWRKGEHLYNCRALGMYTGPVYVCEGMFDVISVWQLGFKRVVGIMGGQLTDAHVKEFKDNTVVFIPDQKQENDYNLFKKSVFRLRRAYPDLVIKVAILPEGDANSVDPEILRTVINSAECAELSILKAELDSCGDRDTEYKLARKIAIDIADPLTKDDIVKWLAVRWEKSHDVVRQALMRSDNTTVARVQTIDDGIQSLQERERQATLEELGMGTLGLHRLINRPHTSQMALLAARANVGKTLLALNLMHGARANDVPSLFISMEQPTSELVFRLALMASPDIEPVDSQRLSHEIINDTEYWQALKYLVRESYPCLRFYDRRLDPQGVKDVIVDASYSIGEKVRVVYIDYLGLMASAMKSNDSYERMSAIGRDIQDVTKEMDVFGIYLMQLSRKGGDGSEKVTLDMMRDSGVLEEVADYIIGAWRDKNRNEFDELDLSKLNLNVCKNRHGKTGEVECWINTKTLLVTPTDYSHA